MLRLLSERILQGVVVLLVVSGIAFALFQFVGDPVSQMLPPDASAADRAALTEALGLNDSPFVQYMRFLGNALAGDFGMSLRHGTPVADLILERLPATVELAGLAVLIALVVGIPIGIFTALRPEGVLSRFALGATLLGMSLPTFLIGILLIMVFSVMTGLLPAFGRGETVTIGFWTTGLLTKDGLEHILLPALTLGVFQTALVVRLVRLPKRFAPRHFGHGPAVRGNHRVLGRHRNGLSVAGDGHALFAVGAVRRHPGPRRLSHLHRFSFCRHQSACGPESSCGRPASSQGRSLICPTSTKTCSPKSSRVSKP